MKASFLLFYYLQIFPLLHSELQHENVLKQRTAAAQKSNPNLTLNQARRLLPLPSGGGPGGRLDQAGGHRLLGPRGLPRGGREQEHHPHLGGDGQSCLHRGRGER